MSLKLRKYLRSDVERRSSLPITSKCALTNVQFSAKAPNILKSETYSDIKEMKEDIEDVNYLYYLSQPCYPKLTNSPLKFRISSSQMSLKDEENIEIVLNGQDKYER